LYRDDEAVFFRASVCGDCLAEVVSGWLERALVKGEAGYWDVQPDGSELEGLWRPQERVLARGNGRHR